MNIVLDCSLCLAFVLPDEQTNGIQEKFAVVMDGANEIVVPHLLWYEAANILHLSVKRKRLKHSDGEDLCKLIDSYNFSTDHTSGAEYSRRLLTLCAQHDLTAYDAAYLELAVRRRAALATLDAKLKEAAEASGLHTI
ncbi:hypothetical protein FACS1894103_6490 [Campylobacterota bacterium]|nr:hypothetical protein FACS1894103_6490 [Campylobacterota bacterium]